MQQCAWVFSPDLYLWQEKMKCCLKTKQKTNCWSMNNLDKEIEFIQAANPRITFPCLIDSLIHSWALEYVINIERAKNTIEQNYTLHDQYVYFTVTLPKRSNFKQLNHFREVKLELGFKLSSLTIGVWQRVIKTIESLDFNNSTNMTINNDGKIVMDNISLESGASFSLPFFCKKKNPTIFA